MQILEDATLRAGTLNDALALLRLYARLHGDNISGVFSNDALEKTVFVKWAGRLTDQPPPSSDGVDFLHIATQTYGQGGHSRLFWKLSRGLAAHGSQGLVLTDSRKEDTGNFPGGVIRLKGRPATRAASIVVAGLNAGTVFLHIHPDDAPAALAARVLVAQGKKVLFVNHADHVFSLGPGAADSVLEICMTGWKTTRDRRAARAQRGPSCVACLA